ncbi:MAG: hypothetical protein AB7N53_06835 [Candidatus Binatia bacterium]
MRRPLLSAPALALASLLGSAVLLSACSDAGSRPAPPANVTPVDLSTAGTIAVRVRYAGAAPQRKPINMSGVPACAAMHSEPVYDRSLLVSDGRLANAVVYIKSGLGDRAFTPPNEPVVIDQRGCLYTPHVAAVMVGQPLQFRNSDKEPHNVHSRPKIADAWNFYMGPQGSTRDVFINKPEMAIPVGCDIHPWMRAYVSAFAHPYFAITPADGAATLQPVPPGEYVVGVWHETLGEQEKPVTVTPRGAADLQFDYPEQTGGK